MSGGQPPKRQSTSRKTAFRRSGHVVSLARRVNARLSRIGSPVKAFTTKRESGRNHKNASVK